MTTFICTAGTSIMTGTGLDLKHYAKRTLSEWDDMLQSIAEAENWALSEVRSKNEQDFCRVSAEINSLIKIGLKPIDRVVLIATETIEGKLCAELVQKVLLERKMCAQVDVAVIIGLQAQDGRRFQRDGLKNLINYISQFEHGDVTFNPTGGFKSVVPYITLAGMIFNKPVKYIHEFSDEVITLANIPIKFDEDLIFSLEYKLRKIETDSYIDQNEWLKGIEFADSRYDCLIEEYGDQVTMSGIGLLLWGKFKSDFPIEMTDEIRLLETQRKRADFNVIISSHFPELELSRHTITTLRERAIDPRVIKCLHSIDHRQATPGMRWHKFDEGKNLWYCRFSQKGRIYVQIRIGLRPLVTDVDYDKKLQ